MLPDLPSFKHDIQYVLDSYLRRAINKHLGIFSEVPRHKVHEGKEMRIYRADGTVGDTGMKEASVETSMKFADIPYMTVEDRIALLDEMAKAMARQMSEHLFSSLNETAEEAGQVVDGKGKPFGIESVFAALEKLHVDFDNQGNPKELQFVVSPALIPRIQEMIEQEKSDPSIKKRHDEIMAKKWQEWRDREAARKLVG